MIQTLVTNARVAGVPVVYVQHESTGWPPLAHGAATWAIDPALLPAADDPIIFKAASDAFTATTLGEVSPDTVVVRGQLAETEEGEARKEKVDKSDRSANLGRATNEPYKRVYRCVARLDHGMRRRTAFPSIA